MTRDQKMGARLVSIATALRLEADGAENFHQLTALADQVEIIADCLLERGPAWYCVICGRPDPCPNHGRR